MKLRTARHSVSRHDRRAVAGRVRLLAAFTSVLLGGSLLMHANSAGASTCSTCVSFVTVFDPDGAGPKPAVTRMHSNLTVEIPYALDVDGQKPDSKIASLPLIGGLLGYEVRVQVTALSATKPTISISRVDLGTPPLPLRIELVNPATTGWTSIGYDTLDASAPSSFTARVDLSDRDHVASTSQTLVDVSIGGPASRFTLVNEQFAGDPAGTRSDRRINRLTFRGDGIATKVPTSITLDSTDDGATQHVVLSHNLATIGDVSITEPPSSTGGGSQTTGTLNPLPAVVDLTLWDLDVNRDGTLDKAVQYKATTPTGVLVTTQSASLTTKNSAQTTTIRVTDLPGLVILTYLPRPTTAAVQAGALDQTDLVYHASSRATELVATSDDGSRQLTATVHNVPVNVNELSSTVTASGNVLAYHADGRAKDVHVVLDDAAKPGKLPTRADALVTDVPADVTITYSSGKTDGHAHYVATGDPAKSVVITTVDGDGQQTDINTGEIPNDVQIDYTKTVQSDLTRHDSETDFSYVASAPLPHIDILGTHFIGLPRNASQMHIVLDDVPTQVTAKLVNNSYFFTHSVENSVPHYCGDSGHEQDAACVVVTTTTVDQSKRHLIALTTPTGVLGHAFVEFTTGPHDALPLTAGNGKPLDGVLYEDLADRFVASVGLTGLDQLTVDQSSGSFRVTVSGKGSPINNSSGDFSAVLDTVAPGHALEVKTETGTAGSPVSVSDNQLAALPNHIALTRAGQSHHTADSDYDTGSTTWSASEIVAGYAAPDGHYVPGFLSRGTSVDGPDVTETSIQSLDPMPRVFSLCQDTRDTCSKHEFDGNLNDLHNNDGMTRTHACDLLTCADQTFPFEAGDASKGSTRIESSQPTKLVDKEGDFHAKVGDYTDLTLVNLRVFGIQGHKEYYDCDAGLVSCKDGYFAIDTDGYALGGHVTKQSDGSVTEMQFQTSTGTAAFQAQNLVWGFEKTGVASGHLATIGSLTCTSNGNDPTKFVLSGQEITEQICNGDFFQGNIFDQI